ncbi:hypothetical protein ENBRE01_2478 [Enteropsectra breve]|nr:hypothetical protein ENBRE01_2478 [Enteropsectra breve]
MNSIENLWGILTQLVYVNGRCYETTEELQQSIEIEWDNIEKSILESLTLFMKDRMIAILIKMDRILKF